KLTSNHTMQSSNLLWTINQGQPLVKSKRRCSNSKQARKPEESSLNWKPWHRDWDATTSNFQEDDASNDGNKHRYNRKGFLEDDDARSDDSIFIVDPGWDDYCLQASKLNRPVPLCPDTRRAQDLNQKVQKVEHLLHEVKKLITGLVLPI
nr:hypothetical protein [Tanacetum cinerariifolium]